MVFGFCDASPVSSDPINDFSLSIEVHDWLVLILKVGQGLAGWGGRRMPLALLTLVCSGDTKEKEL